MDIRGHNGFTAFSQISEHPENTELMTPDIYILTGTDMESQSEYLKLYEQSECSLSPGQKIKYPGTVGSIYGINNSTFHNVVDCRGGGISDRPRIVLYVMAKYKDVEAAHWIGRQSHENAQSPWTAQKKGDNENWAYKEILKAVPRTYKQLMKAQQKWRLPVYMMGLSAAYSVMEDSLRGVTYVRGHYEEKDNSEDVDMSHAPPSFADLEKRVRDIYLERDVTGMSLCDVVDILEKGEMYVTEDVLEALFENNKPNLSNRWYILMGALFMEDMMDID